MNSQAFFVLKVLILSAAVSMAIKYGAPRLAIAATATHSLIAVLLPSLLMAVLLAWRSRAPRTQSED